MSIDESLFSIGGHRHHGAIVISDGFIISCRPHIHQGATHKGAGLDILDIAGNANLIKKVAFIDIQEIGRQRFQFGTSRDNHLPHMFIKHQGHREGEVAVVFLQDDSIAKVQGDEVCNPEESTCLTSSYERACSSTQGCQLNIRRLVSRLVEDEVACCVEHLLVAATSVVASHGIAGDGYRIDIGLPVVISA